MSEAFFDLISSDNFIIFIMADSLLGIGLTFIFKAFQSEGNKAIVSWIFVFDLIFLKLNFGYFITIFIFLDS